MKKYLLAYLGLGAMALFAATNTYKVELYQNSIVDGHNLKPGHYKVEIQNNEAVIKNGSTKVEVPASVETSPTKYASTEIEYLNNTTLQQIRIGGSHTKIVFTSPHAPAAAGE